MLREKQRKLFHALLQFPTHVVQYLYPGNQTIFQHPKKMKGIRQENKKISPLFVDLKLIETNTF